MLEARIVEGGGAAAPFKTKMKIKGIAAILFTCCLTLSGCIDFGNVSDSAYISNLLDIANPHLWDDAVKKGIKLNGYDNSTFRYALSEGTYSFAYYLIDHGTDLEYEDEYGANELMYVCDWIYGPEYEKFIDKLIKSGCDINHTDASGHNLTEHVVISDEVPIESNIQMKKSISFLLKAGSPVRPETLNIITESKNCGYGSLKTMADKIKDQFPEIKPSNCAEALLLGDKAYFQKNIKEDARKEELSEKIAFYAAAYGTVEEMNKYLEETGLTTVIRDKEGNTLLMAAALGGNEETFLYLWDRVSHDTINKRKETLFMTAPGGGNKDIADKIKESDEDIFVSLDWFDSDDVFRQQCEVLSYADDEFTEYYIETEKPDLDETEYLCISIVDNGNTDILSTVKENKNTREFFRNSEFLNNILQLCFSSSQVQIILEDTPNDIKKELTCSLARILGEQTQMPNEDTGEIVQAFYDAGVPLDNYKGVWLPVYEATAVGDTEAVRKPAEPIRMRLKIKQDSLPL